MISLASESLKPFNASSNIDVEAIGLKAVVIAERARHGILTPIELKAELTQLVNDQCSRAKEGRCGE